MSSEIWHRKRAEPCPSKICLRAYAETTDPYLPVHVRRLIRVVTVLSGNYWIIYNVLMGDKDYDETVCVCL